RALGSIGRHAEASDPWLRILRLCPDDREALAALAQNLPEGRSAEFQAAILKTKDGLATALDLADGLWGPRAGPALRSLRELASRQAPGTALVDYLLGVERMKDEDYQAAAAAFRRAFEHEEDDDRKERAVHQFLSAMRSAERMVEGYEQAPDPKAAFAWLTSG